jgi:hypothetical protein
VHSRLSFPSLSLSLSLPLSSRLELLEVLVRGIDTDFGGDPDVDGLRKGETGDVLEVPDPGSESRYHPPVYVRAISWYSVAGPRSSALSTGVSIHPTVHLSSSGTSAVDDRGDWAEMEICED